MKAVRFHEFGGPEVLKFEDVPDPTLRHDQVLVQVKACALNHLDLFIRKGLPGIKLPHINGSDVSGDIIAVGDYITDLEPGQRVLLRLAHLRCSDHLHGLRDLRRVLDRLNAPAYVACAGHT